jgi:MFS family permease
MAVVGTSVPAAGKAAPRMGATVVWLLAVMVFINYVDRGNLATASPQIGDELHLNNKQIALLLSAFFWTYVPAQPLTGWLSEKVSAYVTLGIGLAIWSVATAMTGLAQSFTQLMALRLLLGLGESVAFPGSSKLFGQHLTHERLGWANGLIGLGLALGPAFGTFFGGELIARAGWRDIFLVFGALSALWLVPWFFATRKLVRHDLIRDPDAPREPEPSILALLKQRAYWGTTLGHFFFLYAFYFVISWLPRYLEKAQGFTVKEMAVTAGEIYLVYAAVSMLAGLLSDVMMKAGLGAGWSRKAFLIASNLLVFAALLACTVGDRSLSIAGLFACAAAFGLNTPHIYSVCQTLAGPRASGKWVGMMNGLSNTAGILSPLATGWIVDETGSYVWAFAAAAGAALVAAAVWVGMVGKVKAVRWAGA